MFLPSDKVCRQILIAHYSVIRERIVRRGAPGPSIEEMLKVFENAKQTFKEEMSQDIRNVLEEIFWQGKAFGRVIETNIFVELLCPDRTFSTSIAQELAEIFDPQDETNRNRLTHVIKTDVGNEYYAYALQNMNGLVRRDDGSIFMKCYVSNEY